MCPAPAGGCRLAIRQQAARFHMYRISSVYPHRSYCHDHRRVSGPSRGIPTANEFLDDRNQVNQLLNIARDLARTLKVNGLHPQRPRSCDVRLALGNKQHVLKSGRHVNLVNGCLKDFLVRFKSADLCRKCYPLSGGVKNCLIPRSSNIASYSCSLARTCSGVAGNSPKSETNARTEIAPQNRSSLQGRVKSLTLRAVICSDSDLPACSRGQTE